MMTKAYYSYSSPPITFSPTTSSSTKREGLRFCSTERTLFGIAKVLYEGEEVGRTKNTKHCTIKQSIAVSVEKRVGRMMGSSSDDFGPLPSLFLFNNIYIYIYLFFRYIFFCCCCCCPRFSFVRAVLLLDDAWVRLMGQWKRRWTLMEVGSPHFRLAGPLPTRNFAPADFYRQIDRERSRWIDRSISLSLSLLTMISPSSPILRLQIIVNNETIW